MNASLVANGQKFRPPTENTRPGKATITPRCGGRSGAPHLSAEGGDDPEPYGARSKPALPWFSCGHGSRTGVSVCAWRGCTSVSFELIAKIEIVPRNGAGVNPLFPKLQESGRSPPLCWRHEEKPSKAFLLHVLSAKKAGFPLSPSSASSCPSLQTVPLGS